VVARLKQLETIPKGIEHIHPVEPIERLVGHWREAGSHTPFDKFRKPAHEKRRMRFLVRMKIRIDTEMQSQRTATKPRATTLGEVRRLCFFDQSENVAIEGARQVFLPHWYRELNVIEPNDHCVTMLTMSTRARAVDRVIEKNEEKSRGGSHRTAAESVTQS